MPRIFTFYAEADNTAYPGSTGDTTAYPFVADLQTDAGRREFDVAMAAKFRITQWHVTGLMTRGGFPDDPFDDYQDTAAIANELDFTASGALPPDSPGLLNGQLDIQPSASWATFQLAGTILGARIAYIGADILGAISFRFQAVGPNTGIDADSVNDGVVNTIDIGEVIVRVPAWNGVGYHSLTATLWGSDAGFNADFLIEPSAALEYRDGDGNFPVWDSATGAALLDPVTEPILP